MTQTDELEIRQAAGDEFRFVMPIYAFITILLGFVLLLAVMGLVEQGKAGWGALLALIGAGHIGLYWLNTRFPHRAGRWAFYYVAQTLLLLGMALIVRLNGVAVSLFESAAICLIGEALGWWGNSRRARWIGSFYVALVIVLEFLLDEPPFAIATTLSFLFQVAIVVVIMILFNRMAAAHDRALALAEELESANAQLAASAARIESLTRENERRRMARELHDTLAQGVAGLVLQLEAVKAHLAAERTTTAAGIVDRALDQARDTLAESRAVIDDLRTMPDDFEQEMGNLVADFGASNELDCRLTLELHGLALPAATLGHVQAVAREALINAARHAAASEVHVRVVGRGEMLALTVEDDGAGFDPNNVAAGRYGLLGMEERARLARGRLEIDTRPGSRTTVRLTIEDDLCKGDS
ncbi:MAG: sensor histidine kinase [Caldilineaceae bacterium]|nr:sensor histidine kinase [Caldilineaceae bacterium]